MKTPTAVTELQAQIQQGELGGFTWMTRHLQFFDTFFVLMEKDDLDDFHDSSCRILLFVPETIKFVEPNCSSDRK